MSIMTIEKKLWGCRCLSDPITMIENTKYHKNVLNPIFVDAPKKKFLVVTLHDLNSRKGNHIDLKIRPVLSFKIKNSLRKTFYLNAYKNILTLAFKAEDFKNI